MNRIQRTIFNHPKTILTTTLLIMLILGGWIGYSFAQSSNYIPTYSNGPILTSSYVYVEDGTYYTKEPYGSITYSSSSASSTINYALSLGGDISLGVGTFTLDTNLTAPVAYTHLSGTGNTTILRASTTMDYSLEVQGANSIVENLAFDGANIASFGLAVEADYCTLSNVELRNQNNPSGALTVSASYTTVSNVKIFNVSKTVPANDYSHGNGVVVSADVATRYGNLFSNLQIDTVTSHGFSLFGSNGNTGYTIEKCTMNNIAAYGIQLYYDNSDATITQNYIYSTDVAIFSRNSTKITISENHLTNAIVLGQTDGANPSNQHTIIGNIISDCTTGILIRNGSSNNIIQSNTLVDVGAGTTDAIHVQANAFGQSILGNRVEDSNGNHTASGIYCYGNYAEIIGNYITGTKGTPAIMVRSATKCVVASNIILDCNKGQVGSSGILLQDTTQSVVHSNQVKDTTTTQTRYAIIETGSSNYNQIYGNNLNGGYYTAAITIAGANSTQTPTNIG